MRHVVFLIIAGAALLFAACTKDFQSSEERVSVSFTASVPQMLSTRASSDVIVCAVFHDGQEVTGLRSTLLVGSGSIVYSPKLVKGQKYDVVFWAMKEGAYNVTDLTGISRVSGKAEADYDAFTQSVEYTVDGSAPAAVTLKRPLARINLGVSSEDWSTAAGLGQTPAMATVTVNGAYPSYNAVAQAPSGAAATQTFTLDVTGADLNVNNVVYKTISSNFIFTDGANVSFGYTIYTETSQTAESLLSSGTVNNVPVGKNHNTNIVGNLMTEGVSFTIVIDEAYSDTDSNVGL